MIMNRDHQNKASILIMNPIDAPKDIKKVPLLTAFSILIAISLYIPSPAIMAMPIFTYEAPAGTLTVVPEVTRFSGRNVAFLSTAL